MNTIVVRYQAKPDRAEENQRLIEAVFADLDEREPNGFTYKVFRLEDGATFIHEAVREPDEASPGAEDDDLDRVARALERATTEHDSIEAAAALTFEITYTQGFYEGNTPSVGYLALRVDEYPRRRR